MRSLTTYLIIGLVWGALCLVTVQAEIATQSPENLQKNATHIAVGKVRGVFTSVSRDANWQRSVGVVEFTVAKLEKGEKLEAGEAVYARFWQDRWIGSGNPPPHGSGHHTPQVGDTVRVFLEKKDGGYNALLPNGFEVVEQAKTKAAK